MNRIRKILLAAILFVAIAFVGRWIYRDYQQRQAIALLQAIFSTPTEKPSWRKYLPNTASDVHEWAWADGFLPDYSYLLKARINENEFKDFVKQLGLTPYSPNRQYSDDPLWLSWGAATGFDGNWWDASPSLDSTFVSEGNDTWSYAKFENGYLYFQSLNH